MEFHQFLLSDRFEHAFHVALELHREQTRKNTHAPFMTHLMSVSSLVCENIGFICEDPRKSEDTVMIAILHDTVEDQGGQKTYQRLVREFGQDIADGVIELSDSIPEDGQKPPKSERNQLYYEKIERAPENIVLISCCDKIHNLRTMVADYLVAASPEAFWGAFSASPRDTVDNYERLGELYAKRLPNHRIISLYKDALEGVRKLLPEQ